MWSGSSSLVPAWLARRDSCARTGLPTCGLLKCGDEAGDVPTARAGRAHRPGTPHHGMVSKGAPHYGVRDGVRAALWREREGVSAAERGERDRKIGKLVAAIGRADVDAVGAQDGGQFVVPSRAVRAREGDPVQPG